MKKRFISKSTSALIVAVLVITAFTREPLKLWLLGGAFAVWGVCLIVRALRRKRAARAEERQASEERDDPDQPGGADDDNGGAARSRRPRALDFIVMLLLRGGRFRISDIISRLFY
jgi:hypothetical protein